jgi:iron complex outermembrane receptor protein
MTTSPTQGWSSRTACSSGRPVRRQHLCRQSLLPVALIAATATSVSAQSPAPAASPGAETVQLSTFEVRSEKDRGYLATNSVSGTVFATPIRELPMSVSVATAEFLRDVGATNLQEAANFMPGVTSSPDSRFPTRFIVRGFDNESSILRDGYIRSGFAENYNVDRVEVIQGPASLLYGRNQPGGVLNTITVKPLLGTTHAITTATAGSWERVEGVLDVNTPFGQLDRAAIRVIAAQSDMNGWRDHTYLKKEYLDLQFLWRITPDLQFRAEFEKGYRKSNYGSQVFQGNAAQLNAPTPTVADPTAPGGTRPLRTGDRVGTGFNFPINVEARNYPPGGTRFNAYNADGYALNDVDTLFFEFTWRISSAWSLNVGDVFSRNFSENILNANNRWGDGGQWMPLEWIGSRNRNEQNQLKANLVGDLKLGPTTHQVVFGYQREMTRLRQQTLATDLGRVAWFLFRDPQPRLGSANPRWSAVTNGWSFNEGFYVADMVRALDGRLRLMAGGRRSTQHERFQQQKVSENTLQGGLSYDLAPGITPYVSYSESFVPVNGFNADGSRFVPELGNGFDVGVKLATRDNRISGSIAYFEIEKENIRQNDLARTLAPENTSRQNFFNQGGLARSEGVQAEVIVSPMREMQVQIAYAYTDAYTVKNATLPSLEGRPLGLVSPHYATVVGRYSFSAGSLKGLTLGASIVHGSKKESTGRPDLVLLPNDAYTVGGVFARYATRFLGRETELSVAVRNLTDKFYFSQGSGDSAPFIGDPRSFEASVRVRF